MDSKRFYENYYSRVNGAIPTATLSNMIRFENIFPHALRSGTSLDISCGDGTWLDFLEQRTELELFGADISQIRVNSAKSHLDNTPLFITDICNLPYKDGQLDQVTSFETLEHVPEWKQGLSELIRVASKRVLITVPYNERLKYETCTNCETEASV